MEGWGAVVEGVEELEGVEGVKVPAQEHTSVGATVRHALSRLTCDSGARRGQRHAA